MRQQTIVSCTRRHECTDHPRKELYRWAVNSHTVFVDVSLTNTRRLGTRLTCQSPQPELLLDLGIAIQRSQNYLLQEQNSEGYWVGELIVDSTLVSDTIA